MRHVLLTVFGVALCAVAAAQQARDDGGAARFQAMIQQLTAERAALQARLVLARSI